MFKKNLLAYRHYRAGCCARRRGACPDLAGEAGAHHRAVGPRRRHRHPGAAAGKKFFESMGQTFVVDNRAGAGGIIGAEIAVKSPADGYTIFFTTASLSVGLTLYGSLVKFDAFKELVDLLIAVQFRQHPDTV